MHLTSTLLLTSSLLLAGASSQSDHGQGGSDGPKKPKNAILLSDVQALTLRGGGAMTAHRRAPAVPQLACEASPPALCALHEVDVMRCANAGTGYDADDVQWSCVASLPPELKLGATDVACEGYASPDDPYVLRGSCAVRYRLVLTEAGERRFPELANGDDTGSGSWWSGGDGDDDGIGGTRRAGGRSDPGAIIFAIVFTLVCLWIIWSACVSANGNTRVNIGGGRRRRNNWGGGGGGGSGGGDGSNSWDDPPPPYPGTKSSTSSSSSSSRRSEGWRPGFWTGLAGGAAAGYAAGNRGNNRQERRSNSGWGAGPSSSSSPMSNSRSTSSARYESTGFGSTSRR
ncbi:hypothetical protein GGR52DRAFT_238300 [Hypoxylon sp. FL1284]|nr:hypothetical protein GGR52DRAFT_238300 [Hypoxylon sp. FL1284]